MVEGAIPDLNIVEKERWGLISSIRNSGHEVIEFDFPNELDKNEPKHDFIFIRDPFITDQNGTAVILRAGEPQRRVENKIVKIYLESMGMNIVEIPDQKGIRADGGEFYFCAKDNVLFSGLQRNTRIGADHVAEALNVKEMIILKGDGYHLDTFFTPVINIDGRISALIVCTSILSNGSKKRLYQFADEKDIPVFVIPPDDAIGTGKMIGNFAANALPLPGVLIRPNNFTDPSIDEKLMDMGIDHIITSTSQFQLSGGSVHCMTQ
jgi:N-Dimethylarginine dimethylaminohydrolase